MFPTLFTAAVVALVVIAGGWDLRTRRIPNWLTVSAFALALVLRSFLGWGAALDGLQGAGIAFLIGLAALALGAFGGGDAKLLIAVGAFLGPFPLGTALLATGVAGLVLALGEATRRGAILPVLLGTRDLVRYGITFGRSGARMTLATQGAIAVPYGVAIGIGALFGWFYHGGAL